MSQQAAASEDPEPAGGEGRPGEEEERKKEEEKEANKVVENGGLPGPTVVVQSRTIRSPSDAFLQLQIEKKNPLTSQRCNHLYIAPVPFRCK